MEWRVAVGDAVAADQIVVEVSTDKVDLEVPAPAAGRLVVDRRRRPARPSAVGEPLGEIAAGRGAPAADARRRPERTPAPGGREPLPRPAGSGSGPPRPTPSGRRSRRSPGAWRWRRASTRPPSPAPGPAGSSASPTSWPRGRRPRAAGRGRPARRRRPFRSAPARRRARCAARPPRSPATWTRACRSRPPPASARSPSPILDAQRRQINEQLQDGRALGEALVHPPRSPGPSCGAVARSAVHGRPGSPLVNGKPHKLVRDGVNLGLAVDVERKDGSRSLLVPVVRDAGAAGFRGFRDAYDDLVGRTRAGKVKPDELRGREHQPHQPGRPRDRGLGAAPDAGAGHDHRHRRDRLSGGLRVARAPRRCARWAWRRS